MHARSSGQVLGLEALAHVMQAERGKFLAQPLTLWPQHLWGLGGATTMLDQLWHRHPALSEQPCAARESHQPAKPSVA